MKMKPFTSNLTLCVAIVVTGTLATAAAMFVRKPPPVPASQARNVTNVTVQRIVPTTVSDFFTVTGSLEPWKEVLLSAETSGKIEWQGVDDGDHVDAGQELLKINRVSTEIRLKQARAQYELSLMELKRIEELERGGFSSPQKMDQARLDRDIAVADLQTKEIEYQSSVVAAPFAGVVDSVQKDQDEFVSVGTPLLSLIQVDKVRMVVGIADQDIPHFAVGDAVTVYVDAYKDEAFEGRIHRLAGRAQMATHTFDTEIELDNADGKLKPGMIARAVLVRNSYPDSITIPIFSIIRDQRESYVFVEEDGVAKIRPVAVGFYQGNFAQITGGLAAGDRLIVAGHRNLRDNNPVKMRETVE